MKKQILDGTTVIPHLLRNPELGGASPTLHKWIPVGVYPLGRGMTRRSIRDCFASLAMTRRFFCSLLIFILAMLFLQQQQSQAAGLGGFEFNIKQDCIYTPGKIELTMKLTDAVTIESSYQFRVSVYSAETLIRKQSLTAKPKEPIVFSLEFPAVQTKTDGRCRCELYIGDQFVSCEEKPITLWPPIAAYPDKTINDRTIWTYDTSGRLGEIFRKMEIKTADATFQAVRDFGRPDIVLIGEMLDPNSVSVITGRLSAFEPNFFFVGHDPTAISELTNRLSSFEPKPMVVWLRQKQLPAGFKVEIPTKDNVPVNIKYDSNSPLLTGLNERDILSMVKGCYYVKIKNENIAVKSEITEINKDDKYILSYLSVTEEKGGWTIYCQLPVTDGNPRSILLLNNILKTAVKRTEK
jgi:hypothetical protein